MALGLSCIAKFSENQSALIIGQTHHSGPELADEVRRSLTELEKRGLRPGQDVALTVERDLSSVATLFALMEHRARVFLCSPRASEEERARLRLRYPSLVAVEDDSLAPPSPPPTQEAFRIAVATSGSTGQPRWASLPESALVASALASESVLGWRPEDRWLLTLPLDHVGGLSILTRCALAQRPVIMPTRRGPFDPVALVEEITQHRATLLSLVPAMLRRLLDETEFECPPSLRAILIGGAHADEALLRRAEQRGYPILPTYGMTEACSQIATLRPGSIRRKDWIGPALPGIELTIQDDVVCVRGDTVFEGYVGEPKRRSEDWLFTSDRGELSDDGWLRVLGRQDQIIISGGEKIDPLEVESLLAELDGVAEACVFDLPDPTYGSIVGCVLVLAGEFSLNDLQNALRKLLAPAKRPRQVAVCEAIPCTRSGKKDRRAAREIALREGQKMSYREDPN